MQNRRIVSIPDDIPTGLVIGKNGHVQKSLSQRFGIHSRVDTATKNVILTGSLRSTRDAEQELLNMFESFSLNGRSSYPHARLFFNALKDADAFDYQFVPCSEIGWHKLNFIPLELNRETASHMANRSWIRYLDETQLSDFSQKLKECDKSGDFKVKMSFGVLHFKLLNDLIKERFDWHALSQFRIGEHIKIRHENNCDIANPVIKKLMERFCFSTEFIPVLTVHLKDTLENSSFTIKYHYQDSKWVLKRYHEHRQIQALVNILLDGNTNMRFRVSKRNSEAPNALEKAQKWLEIKHPDDFNRTVAVLSPNAPYHLSIDEQKMKRKTHIEESGLRWTLSYQYNRSEYLVLSARLLAASYYQPSTEFLTLADKVLQICDMKHKTTTGDVNCICCFDEPDIYVCCSKSHAICGGCFSLYVESELNKELVVLSKSKAALKCPDPRCSYEYSMKQVVNHGGEHIAALWKSVLMKLGELDVHLSQKGAVKRHENLLRDVDEALNLQCPSCSAVFLDYDGCDAVKCHACPAYFCGLCLVACQDSSDAHRHAAICSGKSGYFSTVELKAKKHREHKQSKLNRINEVCSKEEKLIIYQERKKIFLENRLIWK